MELHQEGVSQLEIYHYFDNFRQFLGRHGRDEEEGLLGDCLNHILGFCSPSQQWFEGGLTQEEIEDYQNAHETRVIISGCSGGGKSTLLEELERRGYAVQPEPGRLVVQEQLAAGTNALPWENPIWFSELCAEKAIAFYDAATKVDGPVFFDRSPFDQYSGLKRAVLPVPPAVENAITHCRFHRTVFLTPPWEEIYAMDNERRHSFTEAVSEYNALLEDYPTFGFRIVLLPKGTVEERADFVEQELKLKG